MPAGRWRKPPGASARRPRVAGKRIQPDRLRGPVPFDRPDQGREISPVRRLEDRLLWHEFVPPQQAEPIPGSEALELSVVEGFAEANGDLPGEDPVALLSVHGSLSHRPTSHGENITSSED